MDAELLIHLSMIIDKMELTKDLYGIEGLSKEELGTKVMLAFITKLHKAKEEIYQFISDYKGVSIDEAKKTDIITFAKEIIEKSNFNITDFLS